MSKKQKQLQKDWYNDNPVHFSADLTAMANEVHLNRLKKLLAVEPAGRLLEVGCGKGWYTGRLGTATAIDISMESVRHVDPGNARVVGDVEKLPYRDGSFDLVYGFGVLHHLENIEHGLMEIHRVLKPGGHIAFGGENSAHCPLNYLFPILYGNWAVEKGFTRMSKKNIDKQLKNTGYIDTGYSFDGFAVYGMTNSIYKMTKAMERLFTKSAILRKFSGYMYLTARKR